MCDCYYRPALKLNNIIKGVKEDGFSNLSKGNDFQKSLQKFGENKLKLKKNRQDFWENRPKRKNMKKSL